MKKNILILSPHADDEILGCGGFISKYSKLNYHINVLILTNANKGAPEIYPPELIKKVRNEAKSANNLIGTKKLFFENLPAINLNNYPFYKITDIIDKYIADLNPEVVLIPSATCLIIFKFISRRSSLVMPGFRGTPAVIIITSEFFVSS